MGEKVFFTNFADVSPYRPVRYEVLNFVRVRVYMRS